MGAIAQPRHIFLNLAQSGVGSLCFVFPTYSGASLIRTAWDQSLFRLAD
jgi:hypothetical protein